MTTRQSRGLPHRFPAWPWRGVSLALLPDGALELLAIVVADRRLRLALEVELELREGSDRRGPRVAFGGPW